MTLPVEKTTRLRFDGIETYLALQLEGHDGATTITFAGPLLHDGGQSIPDFAYGDPQYLTLSILTSNYVLSEIVYLVAYDSASSSGTITRGEEGTLIAMHSFGDKVVHAPTVVDYEMNAEALQAHIDDPQAHISVIQGVVDNGIAAHEAKDDPHPQYLKKASETGDTIIIEAGQTLWIKYGATLLVEGDIVIRDTGRLFINGHQIIVSNDAPVEPIADVVWIQTFGAP